MSGPASESKQKSSRPTTPLRRIEKGSLSQLSASRNQSDPFPLDVLEPAFAEFADAFADLSANLQYINTIQCNLADFSESFASFLYGLNVNSFCVDFPEAPTKESFQRASEIENEDVRMKTNIVGQKNNILTADPEATFMTNETSFVERPPLRNTHETRPAGRNHQAVGAKGTAGPRKPTQSAARGAPSQAGSVRGRGSFLRGGSRGARGGSGRGRG